jgi:hypothetical protein
VVITLLSLSLGLMPNFVAVNLFRGFDRIGLESAFLVLNSTFLFFWASEVLVGR